VALRALLSLKPANISAFCLYDRAAGGRLLLLLCAVRSALYTARVSCCMCPCPVLRRCRRALSIGRLPLLITNQFLVPCDHMHMHMHALYAICYMGEV
jgi:hypothetical protein